MGSTLTRKKQEVSAAELEREMLLRQFAKKSSEQREEKKYDEAARFRRASTDTGAQQKARERFMKEFQEKFEKRMDATMGTTSFSMYLHYEDPFERSVLDEFIQEKKKWWSVEVNDSYVRMYHCTFRPL